MGIWVPKDIISTLTSEKQPKEPTKNTDMFLEALAKAADKPVKYVSLA
jgi:hypothetical protein